MFVFCYMVRDCCVSAGSFAAGISHECRLVAQNYTSPGSQSQHISISAYKPPRQMYGDAGKRWHIDVGCRGRCSGLLGLDAVVRRARHQGEVVRVASGCLGAFLVQAFLIGPFREWRSAAANAAPWPFLPRFLSALSAAVPQLADPNWAWALRREPTLIVCAALSMVVVRLLVTVLCWRVQPRFPCLSLCFHSARALVFSAFRCVFTVLALWFSPPFVRSLSCACNHLRNSCTAVSQARPHTSINTQSVPHAGRSSVNPDRMPSADLRSSALRPQLAGKQVQEENPADHHQGEVRHLLLRHRSPSARLPFLLAPPTPIPIETPAGGREGGRSDMTERSLAGGQAPCAAASPSRSRSRSTSPGRTRTGTGCEHGPQRT